MFGKLFRKHRLRFDIPVKLKPGESITVTATVAMPPTDDRGAFLDAMTARLKVARQGLNAAVAGATPTTPK